jgi:DNA processing protein
MCYGLCMNNLSLRLGDPEYPSLLKQIYKAPEKLYYKGGLGAFEALENGLAVAFVGTRKATPYGIEVCRRLIADLSLCNVVIVSGLARGIDTVAHRAALENGLKTVAVMGTGIDNVYPAENEALAQDIVARGGLVVSEYYGDAPARDFQFPARNRIIAGLCMATVVIEAPEKSGALITAKIAFEENREVFVVPGDVDREQSVGCNKLLQVSGARPVLSGQDIIRELGMQGELPFGRVAVGRTGVRAGPDFEEIARRHNLPEGASGLLKAIPKTKAVSFDQLCENGEAGVSAQELTKFLSLLEIHQLISSTNSGFYLRTC